MIYRILKYLFIAFSCSFFVFTVSRIIFKFSLMDFQVYHFAVSNFVNGLDPYEINNNLNFIYPPSALVILSPLALFPLFIAEDLWTLVSAVSLVISIYLLLKSINYYSFSRFLLIIGFAALAFPVKFTLGMGQINIIILFLIALSFYFYKQQHVVSSSIVLAIAGAIKLSPFILIFFFLRNRQYKLVVYSVSIFILLNLLAEFLSPGVLRKYAVEIFPNLPTIGNNAYYNQAFSALLAKLEISYQFSKIINYSLLGLLIIIVLVIKTKDKLLEFGLFLTVGLIGGGLAWQHHFVLTIILFVASLKLAKTRFQRLALIISYLLISYNFKNPPTNFFSLHVLWGSILLFILGLELNKTHLRKFLSNLQVKD